MSRQPKGDSVNEMESIQKGLEAFLQQELQKELQTGASGRSAADSREPQIFDMEEPKKDLDIISTDNTRGAGKRSRRREDDYLEDWDSGDRRRRVVYVDSEDPDDDMDEQDYEEERERVRAVKRAGSRETGKKASSKASPKTPPKASEGKTSGNTGRAPQKAKQGNTGKRSKGAGEDYGSRAAKRSRAASGKEGSGRREKPPKKKSGLKRFLITFFVILALLLTGLYYVVGIVYNEMKFEKIDSLAGAPMKEDGVINILLIGNDSRENGEDGRSDAMILLSISSRTKKVYMTSLLRDMYVDIPGHDGNRLNAAYSFGGAELLMETIEKNLDITVNRYMLVNFEAFANLVDAVDGVDLELTSQEIEYVNGYLVEYNILLGRAEGTDYMDTSQGGVVHLNGAQALAYSRNRYLGTDFGRTERQRKVLEAVIKKLPLAILTNPKELIEGLMPNLTTNLTKTECYRLGLTAAKMLTYDMEQLVIPQPGTYSDASIRGMAVLQVDFAANKKYLEDALFGTDAAQ